MNHHEIQSASCSPLAAAVARRALGGTSRRMPGRPARPEGNGQPKSDSPASGVTDKVVTVDRPGQGAGGDLKAACSARAGSTSRPAAWCRGTAMATGRR